MNILTLDEVIKKIEHNEADILEFYEPPQVMIIEHETVNVYKMQQIGQTYYYVKYCEYKTGITTN
jgi:hypothetical protein